LLIVTTVLATLAHGQQQNKSHRAQAFERAQDLEALGRKMFFDTSLSGSGKIACGTCHDPSFAYGPPNALPVQPGGQKRA
jgi:cytochrome c peroxidase